MEKKIDDLYWWLFEFSHVKKHLKVNEKLKKKNDMRERMVLNTVPIKILFSYSLRLKKNYKLLQCKISKARNSWFSDAIVSLEHYHTCL